MRLHVIGSAAVLLTRAQYSDDTQAFADSTARTPTRRPGPMP